MRKATQEGHILAALQSGIGLTPLAVWRWYGCERLAARIYDLKRKGYAIERRMIRTSGGAYVAQYWMRRG